MCIRRRREGIGQIVARRGNNAVGHVVVSTSIGRLTKHAVRRAGPEKSRILGAITSRWLHAWRFGEQACDARGPGYFKGKGGVRRQGRRLTMYVMAHPQAELSVEVSYHPGRGAKSSVRRMVRGRMEWPGEDTHSRAAVGSTEAAAALEAKRAGTREVAEAGCGALQATVGRREM